MLRKLPWFAPDGGLEYEYAQAVSEGLPVQAMQARFEAAASLEPGSPERIRLAVALHEEVAALAAAHPEAAAAEPSDLEGILALAPAPPDLPPPDTDDGLRYDRVYGAWLGRCAGCLLGQPVEGWDRARIEGFCRETGNLPVRGYLRSDVPEGIRATYRVADRLDWAGGKTVNWLNNVACMPEDDDTNYTILGLRILETYGPGFTSDDVAEAWLQNLPMLHLCTAERVAYRNVANGIFPPASAAFRNPFREWIGAQIRADFFGYIAPGDPRRAASAAHRDAAVSHVRNGIYGEMWVAAMLAAAAVTQDAGLVLEAGLSVVPAGSRLAAAVRGIAEAHRRGEGVRETVDGIHARHRESWEHDWCHVLSNAQVVAAALLYGGGDLGTTLGIALTSGFDTDCNGATAGSLVGMMRGASALPAEWIAPLRDTVLSGVDGMGRAALSDLARRTMAFVRLPDAGA